VSNHLRQGSARPTRGSRRSGSVPTACSPAGRPAFSTPKPLSLGLTQRPAARGDFAPPKASTARLTLGLRRLALPEPLVSECL
jgi:hypothetical protein